MPSRQICFRFASVFFILIMTSHAWAVPGQLDNTFGINGVAMDGLASHPTCSLYPADTAQQADGSILVAGWYDSGTQLAKLAQVLLRRYQPNGFYDPHFGMDGFAVASNVPGLPVEVWGIGKAVAVQPDGKILVAGLSYANSGDLQDTRMTVWRFTSTGILDTTFGNDGIALIYSPTVGSALALSVYQGKIIVATRIVQGAETDTVLFRLNSDGSLDGSFGYFGWLLTGGQNGATLSGLHTMGGARALTVDQVSGDIFVGGHYYDTSPHLGIARYTQSGMPVSGFGTNGVAMTPTDFGSNGCGIADTTAVRYDSVMLYADGRVAAGGYVGNLAAQFWTSYTLWRYTASGATDLTFSSDGYIQGSCSTFAYQLSSSVLQSNGKIIHLVPVNDLSNSATLYRILSNGYYDFTWAPVNTNFGGSQRLMLQTATGKLIRQGVFSSNGGKPRVMLGRYLL